MKHCMLCNSGRRTRRRQAPAASRWPGAGCPPAARSISRARRLGILLALAASLWLVACGSGAVVSPPPPAGPTPTVTVPVEMPVVISIAGAFDDRTLAVLDRQIDAFEADHPAILVEVVDAPAADQERRQAFAEALAQGDTGRDIYVVDYHWLAELSAPGWLQALDGLGQAPGLDLSSFLPAAVEASRIDSVRLALPWTVDAGLLYYRLDHLAGPPATWPELQQAALDAAPSAALPYGYLWAAAADDSLTCASLEFVWSYGGDVLDPLARVVFDSPETRAALQEMADLVSSGASPQQVTTYTEADALAAFQSGQGLMVRGRAGAWQRLAAPGSALAGEIAVAPLPAACLGGQGLVLSGSSLYPQQAFQFMTFLVAHEQQAELAREGAQMPALEAVYRDPGLLAEQPALADLHAGLAAARPRPKYAAYEALSEAIYSEVHLLLLGEQDSEATAARIQGRLEALSPQR